jgi:DNA-binding response OmpR family regulator
VLRFERSQRKCLEEIVSPIKVLAVDDEERLLELVESLLTLKGDFQVSTASNGEEALTKVKEEQPDVILLDVVMPQMDGPTLAHKLRESSSTADIPIIFLTGLVESAPTDYHGPELGGQLYLSKPFDSEDLFKIIDLALERKSAP